MSAAHMTYPRCLGDGVRGVEEPGPAHSVEPGGDAFTATDDLKLEHLDQVGGIAAAVAVGDGYAYLGQGSRLLVVDVSDSAAPTLAGVTSPLSLIHISEPTRPYYITYAVFCLKKKNLKLVVQVFS